MDTTFSTHFTDEKLSSGNISVTQPEAEELHLSEVAFLIYLYSSWEPESFQFWEGLDIKKDVLILFTKV